MTVAALLALFFLQNFTAGALLNIFSFFYTNEGSGYLLFTAFALRTQRSDTFLATPKSDLLLFVEARKDTILKAAYDILQARIQREEITTTAEIDLLLTNFAEVPQLLANVITDLQSERISVSPDSVRTRLLERFLADETAS